MKFDQNTPLLTGDYDGDTVVLVAQVNGVRDKKFARNFVTAKNLADQGRVSRIVVKSVGSGVRAEDALRRVLGSGHPVVEVCRDECDGCPLKVAERPAKARKRGDRAVVPNGDNVTTVDAGVAREWNAGTFEFVGGVQGEGTSPPDTDR